MFKVVRKKSRVSLSRWSGELSRPHLELSRLGDVLDPLERLVPLVPHVQPADPQPAQRHLLDLEAHVEARLLLGGRHPRLQRQNSPELGRPARLHLAHLPRQHVGHRAERVLSLKNKCCKYHVAQLYNK